MYEMTINYLLQVLWAMVLRLIASLVYTGVLALHMVLLYVTT